MGASRDLTRTFVEWRAMREKPLAGRTFGGYERGSSQEHSPISSSRAALPPGAARRRRGAAAPTSPAE